LEGWRNSAGIRFPSVSEGRHGVDLSLTWAPACVRTLNAPVGGAQVGGRQDHESLERGGDSLEGVSGPQARRSLTRGGDQPSSEAEPHPRGRPALERGGVSLVRCCAPRAKQSFARGGLGLTVLVGRWGRQVRGPLPLGRDRLGRVLWLWGCLCFVICERKWSSPQFFRGPLWPSPIVAPEHLQWYPLGSHRG
jgi:hypothetical protein